MRFRPSWLMVSALLCCATPLLAAPPDEVKALLDKGNAAGAYALGKKHPEELGNPAFDFHFGVAAIDSGHAGEGVLALERYVVNFPGNNAARLELARGYFVMGDDQRAREEFNGVLGTKPPAAVVANIERFLDSLRSRESTCSGTATLGKTGIFMGPSGDHLGVSFSAITNSGPTADAETAKIFSCAPSC